MREQLLAWQWSLYPDGHQDRRNLLIHILTVPLFEMGSLCLVCSAFDLSLAIFGVAAMATALVMQGRGHKGERVAPVAFTGPLDVVSRFFAEQWVTFPRFVLSGGFMRAWRASA